VCGCAWVAIFASSARAALVNWDNLTWAPGTLSNSYDVDPGNPGNDVTFAMSGSTNRFTNDQQSNIRTPAITMSLGGGLSPIENSLQLAANLQTQSKITFTVNFSQQYAFGVSNVSFSIFDIDLDTNKDKISNIYGIALDGTHVAASITLGSAINRNGNGLNQTLVGVINVPDNGPGAAAGTATISFGSTPITGFAFTWSNSLGSEHYQEIAIGDIFYNVVVPEVNPAAAVAIVCLLAASIRVRGFRNR
jgi:hypothetical protein